MNSRGGRMANLAGQQVSRLYKDSLQATWVAAVHTLMFLEEALV